MVDYDFVSGNIHDDDGDDGDGEEDTRIDGERGAATRDRIISCNWQTPLLWMEVCWHFYYGEHHDDGDDDGNDDDESWWWKSLLQLAYNTNVLDNAELKTTSESKLADWQEVTDNDIDIDEEMWWPLPARH